ncbi:MAG: tetratricopeptide repeat protein [Gaiellales bacterium]
MLIYFDAETCARVVAGLERSLTPGGLLMLGSADALCVSRIAAGRRAMQRPRPTPPSREHPARPLTRRAEPSPPLSVSEDAMDPQTHYRHGLAELESGDPSAAVSSLRRVLYLDPESELASFALGRAHEKAGEPQAARRRYEQTLRMLRSRPVSADARTSPTDAATVIDACVARVAALSGGPR